MNVALVNKNPAVSRLITLSLNKIGAEYVEIDDINNLENIYSYIIIDSDVSVGDVDMSMFKAAIMALVPRGGKKPDFADVALEKPFLPTEFVAVFEQSRPKEDLFVAEDLSENFTDFGDNSEVQSDLEGVEELAEIDIPTMQEDGIDEFSFEEPNLDSLKEVEEPNFNESTIEQIGSLVDEIENMQEFNIDENLQLASDEELMQEFGDELLKDDDSDIEKSKNELEQIELMDELDTSFSEEILEEAKADDSLSENLDEFMVDESVQTDDAIQDKIGSSETVAMDEINLQDLNFDEFSEPETPAVSQDEPVDELEDLVVDEDVLKDEQNDNEFLVDEGVLQEKTAQIDSDEFLVDESVLLGSNESEIAAAQPLDETAPDELNLTDQALEIDENLENLKQEQGTTSSIDEIDEAAMLAAFGLASAPQDLAGKSDVQENANEAKSQLREKIAQQIADLLNESAIKEMLKDVNISVNVSFEEK